MSSRIIRSVGGARARRGMTSGEMVVASLAGAIVLSSAVFVVPRVVGASGGEETDERELRLPNDPARLEAMKMVREFVRAGKVLAGADGSTGSLAFWHADERDEGYMNAEEIVVLSYREMLGAFVVSRSEAGGDSFSPRLGDGKTIGPGFFDRWRSREGVVTGVLAGGFDDVRVETAGVRAGSARVVVRFNWAGEGDDGSSVEFGFEHALPAVDGWERVR